MDVDPVRKRIFVSRDPRGFTGAGDARQLPVRRSARDRRGRPDATCARSASSLLPAGHTSTCVNGCDHLWTGGPIPGIGQPADWEGRPIFATDVRDPANPKPCPDPIDTGRNDGVTDYVHDVQVDAAGVAWVSGRRRRARLLDERPAPQPAQRRDRDRHRLQAGALRRQRHARLATPSRFMHNSFRDPAPAATARRRPHAGRAAAGRAARAPSAAAPRPAGSASGRPPPASRPSACCTAPRRTLTSDCARSGRFATYDLEGTFGGEGFKDIAKTKHRMRVLDTWTPEGQEGGAELRLRPLLRAARRRGVRQRLLRSRAALPRRVEPVRHPPDRLVPAGRARRRSRPTGTTGSSSSPTPSAASTSSASAGARLARPPRERRRRDHRAQAEDGPSARLPLPAGPAGHGLSERLSSAIRSTAWAASSPWWRFSPTRASAWSMLSTVRTPKAQGTPVSSETSAIPRAASAQT